MSACDGANSSLLGGAAAAWPLIDMGSRGVASAWTFA